MIDRFCQETLCHIRLFCSKTPKSCFTVNYSNNVPVTITDRPHFCSNATMLAMFSKKVVIKAITYSDFTSLLKYL